MSGSKIVLAIVGLAVISVGILFYFSPVGPGSPYHRFHSHDAGYYDRLARACDTIIQEHTNYTPHAQASPGHGESAFIWLDTNNVVWDDIRLSPIDRSLPEAVRALHPEEILLEPDRVFFGFGAGRLGWAIIWQQDDLNKNRWTLSSNAEGFVKTVYTETK